MTMSFWHREDIARHWSIVPSAMLAWAILFAACSVRPLLAGEAKITELRKKAEAAAAANPDDEKLLYKALLELAQAENEKTVQSLLEEKPINPGAALKALSDLADTRTEAETWPSATVFYGQFLDRVPDGPVRDRIAYDWARSRAAEMGTIGILCNDDDAKIAALAETFATGAAASARFELKPETANALRLPDYDPRRADCGVLRVQEATCRPATPFLDPAKVIDSVPTQKGSELFDILLEARTKLAQQWQNDGKPPRPPADEKQ